VTITTMRYLLIILIATGGTLLATGCSNELPRGTRTAHAAETSERFEVRGEPCAACGAAIQSTRFGAVVRKHDGETLVFGSAECLARQVSGGLLHLGPADAILIADYVHGNRLIPVDQARFLHSVNVVSPGGGNIAAFEASEHLEFNMMFSLGGKVLTWDGVLEGITSRE
jgi:hypothetical protein